MPVRRRRRDRVSVPGASLRGNGDSGGEIVADRFFQAAYLSLGDVDLLGDLHLRFTLEKPQLQNIVFTLVQVVHCIV